MILTNDMLKVKSECDEMGKKTLFLSDLKDFPTVNEKLRMFSLAQLEPGGRVNFHKHIDECEYYYIISGKGIYNDNGKEIEVFPGTVTYTPNGESHGLKNTGNEKLEFIALIIRD